MTDIDPEVLTAANFIGMEARRIVRQEIAEYDHVILKDTAREIAREEIASMAGLILRRVQEEHPTRLSEHNVAEDAVNATLARIFGEILSGGYGEEQ